MKKLFLFLPLTFLPVPAQAITWNEFWAPFTYDRGYYPAPRYYDPPMCNRRVYREEYYPPTRWEPGYIRRYSEWIRVPCDY
jgi:hypothetical protein